MEAEALEAIFDTAFTVVNESQPFVWSVRILPVDCGGDEAEELAENHVAVKLVATIPPNYPEECGPDLDVEIERGLADQHRKELVTLAKEEAEANEGMPAIFAVCEAVRGWLSDNNEKGLDDASMHAQMMRKMKDEERNKAKQSQQFESQKKKEVMSEAELEELVVRKRREEGTPCTEESFLAWAKQFEEEMEELANQEAEREKEASGAGKKKGTTDNMAKKDLEAEARPTGFDIFSGKAGTVSLEALEAAAEEAADEKDDDDDVEVDDLDVDEELFDDDEDLDDLDFEDDSDEEEPDI